MKMGKPMTLHSGTVIDNDEFGQIFGGGIKHTLDKVRTLNVSGEVFEYTYRGIDKVQELIDLLVAENERMASVLRFDARNKPIVRVKAVSVSTAIDPSALTRRSRYRAHIREIEDRDVRPYGQPDNEAKRQRRSDQIKASKARRKAVMTPEQIEEQRAKDRDRMRAARATSGSISA